MMMDGYISSGIKCPYFIIGNHLTNYGDVLKDKYRNFDIIFLGGIFNKNQLDNFRYYSKYYLHGHSVGGTNPALIEAMAANTFILVHDNQFNKSVVNKNAYYFNSSNALSDLLQNEEILKNKNEFAKNNINKIDKVYRWPIIVNQYESYFKKILDNK
jgi:glycosyltransferase involved in cell wall biosynthesis